MSVLLVSHCSIILSSQRLLLALQRMFFLFTSSTRIASYRWYVFVTCTVNTYVRFLSLERKHLEINVTYHDSRPRMAKVDVTLPEGLCPGLTGHIMLYHRSDDDDGKFITASLNHSTDSASFLIPTGSILRVNYYRVCGNTIETLNAKQYIGKWHCHFAGVDHTQEPSRAVRRIRVHGFVNVLNESASRCSLLSKRSLQLLFCSSIGLVQYFYLVYLIKKKTNSFGKSCFPSSLASVW